MNEHEFDPEIMKVEGLVAAMTDVWPTLRGLREAVKLNTFEITRRQLELDRLYRQQSRLEEVLALFEATVREITSGN